MLKHILRKIFGSITQSKQHGRKYSSSNRFRQTRRYSSSDRRGGYGRGYYKNRHGSSS